MRKYKWLSNVIYLFQYTFYEYKFKYTFLLELKNHKGLNILTTIATGLLKKVDETVV